MMLIISLFCGLIFGLGLLISGMANPQKVLGFLDITGLWDPSLILVMAGAILAALLPFQWAKNQSRSLLGQTMQLPDKTQIDRPLIVGSLLFGIGWGLAGICPGPAIVLLGLKQINAIYFVLAMLAGMWIFQILQKRK
ncbi:MAG: YeeE/YedE family protein [Candidatus Methylopumilus sp.]|nr:YeeE/YedE family protein [Candidatus Methylopumilus sp.]NBW60199.1 YeeE/YedE family protein [Methylophilaceae bacterium]